MLPDKMEHCIVFMNSWDVSDVFWSFSKCNITIPHFPTDPSTAIYSNPIAHLYSPHYVYETEIQLRQWPLRNGGSRSRRDRQRELSASPESAPRGPPGLETLFTRVTAPCAPVACARLWAVG